MSNLSLKLFSFSFFLIFSYTQAQKDDEAIDANRYMHIGDSLLNVQNYSEASAYYEKALRIFQRKTPLSDFMGCLNKLSEAYIRDNKLERGKEITEKILKGGGVKQPKNRSEVANLYDNLGLYYAKKGVYKNALSNYKKARDIREEIFEGNHAQIAISYFNLGATYSSMGKYENALTYSNKALTILERDMFSHYLERAGCYNTKGNVGFYRGEFDKALSHYKESAHIYVNGLGKDHYSLAIIYNNIGNIFYKKGDYEETTNYYNKALQLYRNKYGEAHRIVGALYGNIALVYLRRGRHTQALEYAHHALNTSLSLFDKDHPTLGNQYGILSVIYDKLDNNEEALNYGKKALQIYLKSYGELHRKTARMYSNLSSFYAEMGLNKLAVTNLKKTIKIQKRMFGEDNINLANTYRVIGLIYSDMGSKALALDYHLKNLDINIKAYGTDHPEVANAHYFIGKHYQGLGMLIKAIENYELPLKPYQNLETNRLNFESIPEDYEYISIIQSLLLSKGECLKREYLRTNDLKKLKTSFTIYKDLDSLAKTHRKLFNDYSDRITLSKDLKVIYEGAIEVSQLLNRHKDKGQSYELAFYFSERNRANILKELLNDNEAKSFAGIPDKMLFRETELTKQRSLQRSKIQGQRNKVNEMDSLLLDSYKKELFNTNRSYDSLTEVFRTEYPEYYTIKHNNKVISVTEVQSALTNTTTLLEFFVADNNMYAFVISKDTFQVRELSVDYLSQKIRTFKNAINLKDTQQFKKVGNELYTILFEPIKEYLKGDELIIIPDALLWDLNFDLLLTRKETSNDPKEFQYLLKEYAISYANSATVLFHDKDSAYDTKPECLAFSFSDTTQVMGTVPVRLSSLREIGGDLPGTREEIRAIAEIVDGEYFFGAQAIESNFKTKASDYAILHLALHGEVDDKNPENSRLYFTQAKDTLEDNYLYSHELFALHLPADLAVLSACNTGTGRLTSGEGVMSLGNAFQYAGTKSLLISGWEVSDKVAPELMKSFYENLKKGMRKSKALQQAKLEYLGTASASRAHPFYWGGFYLLGDSAPLIIGRKGYNMYAFIGGIVVIIMGVFIYFLRKRTA